MQWKSMEANVVWLTLFENKYSFKDVLQIVPDNPSSRGKMLGLAAPPFIQTV